MQNFKYNSSFGSSIVKCVTSEEKDSLLALASLQQLQNFIPSIDTKTNFDLLPISFSACTVNRVNKNDDVINTKTALAIYKNFIWKPIDIEHKRLNIAGVILTAGFCEFGTEKPLTEEEVKNFTGPFNIVLGGVIWKIAHSELAEMIENSNDPTSNEYLSISASWELAFEDYQIVELPKGQKNIFGGKLIAEASEVDKLSKKLRANGGTGEVDGLKIYRMPVGSVCPVGIGLTEKPAADVKGVAVLPDDTKDNKDENANAALDGVPTYDFYFCPKCDTEAPKDFKSLTINPYGHVECPTCKTTTPPSKWANKPSKSNPKLSNDAKKNSESTLTINKKNKINDVLEKNISQSTILCVNKEVGQFKNFMFKSLKDITDENLKTAIASDTAVASSINELISNTFREKESVWLNEKNQIVNDRIKAQEQFAANAAELTEAKNSLKQLQATVDALSKEKEEREAVAKFNERMSLLDNEYDFDNEVKEIVASELKSLTSDEDYTKWEAKAKKLFKPFKKKDKKDDTSKDDSSDDDSKDNSDASKKSKADDMDAKKVKADDDMEAKKKKEDKSDASIVDDAIDNAKKHGAIANTLDLNTPSIFEKYKAAFAIDQFIIKK